MFLQGFLVNPNNIRYCFEL